MKRIKGKRLICAVCILVLLVPTASFGAVKIIPDSSVTVSGSTVLKMGAVNYTAKWSGVSGKTVKSEQYGTPCLMVPIKSTTSAWTYRDFLDVTFTNAGKIAGRSVDVKLHFNSMTVNEAFYTGNMREDNHMCVLSLYNQTISMSAGPASGAGYAAPAVYDVTATIVWSDTGTTVNMPFFIVASDLDGGNEYFKEGWEAVSGFPGTFYIYRDSVLVNSGNKFSAPGGVSTSDGDEVIKAGVYAPTTGGSFRMKYYEGNCATGVSIYSQYSILEAPVKTIW